MKIKIKYLADIEPLEQHGNFIDLRVSEDVVMHQGEFRLLPLGVAMKLPKGYYAEVVPRSSTFKKHKIVQANSVGIIDNGYCGNGDMWYFPAYAVEDTEFEKNTRICQFRIVKSQPSIIFEVVEDLGSPDRGGIGSTGIK